MSVLTEEQFKAALPAQMRRNVNQEMMSSINANLTSDADTMEAYRDGVIGYASVLNQGRFKTIDYISAVKYVTQKLMGQTNKQAFYRTFPEKYARFCDNATSEKDISSHVAMYNKNILVNLIMKQTLIPTYILNADIHQKAINVQLDLMTDDSVSPKVRSDAANSLLTHLKAPEAIKVELDVGIKEDSMLTDLKKLTSDLAAKQLEAIEHGTFTVEQIAHQDILTIEQ